MATTMLSSITPKLNSTFSPSKPISPTTISTQFKRNPSKISVSFNEISDDLLENTLHLDQYPLFKSGYDQFQRVTESFPESEKWGVFVFAGLVWVYLTARPGVLIGAIDAYLLAPAQKVFDGLSGRRNLKTSDFLVGDKLGEGSFGVVYSGLVVPKNMSVEERVRNSGSRRKQLEKDPRFKEKVILKQYFQEWTAMKEATANATFMQLISQVNNVQRFYWFSIQMTNKGVKLDYKKIMSTFFALDFSSNMFTGNIPKTITTLSGLQLLNLSNNELSGVIPSSMRNLIHLEALDLSSNKLSGTIPQDLVQLNFLELLNVSNNGLTGPIPQGKQFNTFSNNSYMGNQALCGFPLSIKCGDSKASDTPKVPFEDDTESYLPHGIDWVVILFGVVSGLVIGIVCGDYLKTRYYKLFFPKIQKVRR